MKLIKLLASLSIAVTATNLYLFVLGIFLQKEAAGIAGAGFAIGVLSIYYSATYRAEVKNIWDNIKRNRRK